MIGLLIAASLAPVNAQNKPGEGNDGLLRVSIATVDLRAPGVKGRPLSRDFFIRSVEEFSALPNKPTPLQGPFSVSASNEIQLYEKQMGSDEMEQYVPKFRFPIDQNQRDGLHLLIRAIGASGEQRWLHNYFDSDGFGPGKLAVINLYTRKIALNAAGHSVEIVPGGYSIISHDEENAYRVEVKVARNTNVGWEMAQKEVVYRYPEEQIVFLAYQPEGGIGKIALARLPNFSVNAQAVDPDLIREQQRELLEMQTAAGRNANGKAEINTDVQVPSY